MTFTPVTRHTRAGNEGKLIKCLCGEHLRVYHFAWSAIVCLGCRNMVDKYEWKVAA